VNKAASYFRDVGAGDPDDELLDLATCTNFAWQQSSLPSVNPSDRFRPTRAPAVSGKNIRNTFGKAPQRRAWDGRSAPRLPVGPSFSGMLARIRQTFFLKNMEACKLPSRRSVLANLASRLNIEV